MAKIDDMKIENAKTTEIKICGDNGQESSVIREDGFVRMTVEDRINISTMELKPKGIYVSFDNKIQERIEELEKRVAELEGNQEQPNKKFCSFSQDAFVRKSN